jgi:phosphohistidine phosphatase
MKQLLLLRHAKSSWDTPSLADFDRPLANKGLEDCKLIKKELQDMALVPERVFCSPALRTRQTAGIVFKDIKTKYQPELYLCSVSTVFNSILAIKDKHQFAALVFHNYAITDFVNEIAYGSIDNIRTAGLVHVTIDGNWEDIYNRSKLRVKYFDREQWIDLNG